MGDLSGADLSGANLTDAGCEYTVFTDADLSRTLGLDDLDHRGPSTIGVDTLFKFGGRFPESFLRGVSVPEPLTEYLPSLIGAMQPIQFYSCFISYSHVDEEFCKRLHSK